jgi:hypothetical protein
MPLKLHFLDFHLDLLPQNLGEVSDERGEGFHQDIFIMEKKVREKMELWYACRMLLFIVREIPESCYRRRSKRLYICPRVK